MQIILNITGFGRFQGVDDNPSARLVSELLPPLLSASPGFKLGGTTVLEVSCEGVHAVLPSLFSHVSTSSEGGGGPTVVVNLHIGVNAGGKTMSLEKCGYNLCDFRCKDERGSQLRDVPVVGALEKSCVFETSLDLSGIMSILGPSWEKEVDISTDPGRFLCNFVYACSLHQSLQHNSSTNNISNSGTAVTYHSLFVHVPLATTIALERQSQFFQALVHAICDSIRGGHRGEVRVVHSTTSTPSQGGAKSGDITHPRHASILEQLAELGFTGPGVEKVVRGLPTDQDDTDMDTVVARILEMQEDGTPPTPPPPPPPTFNLSSLLPPRYKMVIVTRSDLELSPGKLAAQACHAALAAHRHALSRPEMLAPLKTWQGSGEKIVCLKGGGGELGGLAKVLAAAKAAGLPAFPCRDAGRTEVEPGTMTVVAVGPGLESQIDLVTGDLRLL